MLFRAGLFVLPEIVDLELIFDLGLRDNKLLDLLANLSVKSYFDRTLNQITTSVCID